MKNERIALGTDVPRKTSAVLQPRVDEPAR